MVSLAAGQHAVTAPARLALIGLGLALVVLLIPILLLTLRRMAFGSAGWVDRRRGRARADRTDAWAEAGRRVRPDPGGGGRLDDTVDLDPFGPGDGDGW